VKIGESWSPFYGCGMHVSEGCLNCYAERDMRMYGRDFNVVKLSGTLRNPELRKKPYDKPTLIFSPPWSDWCHPQAAAFRQQAWRVIDNSPQHTFRLLTKLPQLYSKCLPRPPLPPWGSGWDNVWLGTSLELAKYKWRIKELQKIPAKGSWLSIEPLLGPIRLTKKDLKGISLVVTGGESGPNARRSKMKWFLDIRNACKRSHVAFFHKQNGNLGSSRGSRPCKCHAAWGCMLLPPKTGKIYAQLPLPPNIPYRRVVHLHPRRKKKTPPIPPGALQPTP
jgi:protein gp37